VPLPRRPLPLLSPHPELFQQLLGYPVAALRAHAARRGLDLPPRTGRRALAAALVQSVQLARATEVDAAGEPTFEGRDDAYPVIARALRERGATSVLDLGCGPGLFAEALRGEHPGLRRYLGVDHVEGLVARARRRFARSRRFAFRAGGLHPLPEPGWAPDAVVLAFVLSYLDTAGADRALEAIARTYPRATLFAAVTFASCAERRKEAAEGDPRELARRALQGDAAAAAAWETARLGSYLRALEDRYRVEVEQVLPGGYQVLWVARARAYAGTAHGSGRHSSRPVRISGKSRRTTAASR
jgi:SAM-dependent methyltransferase